MITCNYCGQKNRDDSLECRKCGAPLGDSESLQEKLASVKGGWFSTPEMYDDAMADKQYVDRFVHEWTENANACMGYVDAGISPSIALQLVGIDADKR